MPTYLYRDPKNNIVEVVMTISEMLEKEIDGVLIKDGVELTRDLCAEHSTEQRGCASWPMKSDACGIHPSQAGEFYEHSVKIGVPTQFDSRTGQAIFMDRAHRKKYLAARGFHDRNGGYGD